MPSACIKRADFSQLGSVIFQEKRSTLNIIMISIKTRPFPTQCNIAFLTAVYCRPSCDLLLLIGSFWSKWRPALRSILIGITFVSCTVLTSPPLYLIVRYVLDILNTSICTSFWRSFDTQVILPYRKKSLDNLNTKVLL